MTASGPIDALRVTVEVDYGQWYLFDADRVGGATGEAVVDVVDDALLWEQRCASGDWGAIVYTLKSGGPTPVVARSWPAAPPIDDAAEHLAECSITVPSGRLALSGWDSDNVAGVLPVPGVPLRVRIGWYGLERETAEDDPDVEHLTIDVFPGDVAPTVVRRCWPPWTPPPRESTTQDGRRMYAGAAAAEARKRLEWVPRMFWSPYPETPDGSVTGLWRDPLDGTRWADGSGPGGHAYLRELSADEADALEAQGFPSVRTYAIDADGRVWTSDVMPLERVPCLNLVSPSRFEMLKGLADDRVGVQVIDLPPGWDRLVRRPRQGGGPPVEVAGVDDADDGMYQRWRDDQPAPTS